MLSDDADYSQMTLQMLIKMIIALIRAQLALIRVMKIIPLSEGSFTIDKTKLFVPFNTAMDDLQQRPIGSLLVEVQPFVVITSEDILLLDTGLGIYQ